MFLQNIITTGAFLSLVAAVPLQNVAKRDMVTDTTVQWDVVTVPVTTTIWVEPGQMPTGSAAPVAPAAPKKHGHHNHHSRPQITSHIHSTVTVQPSPPVASQPPAESQNSPPPPPPTTTSAAPAPPASSAAPPPASSQAPSGGSGSGGPGGAQTYTGDITHYAPGLGSCGITSTASQAIVALPEALMEQYDGANPNDNPLCGKTITISYQGKTTDATVVDTCPGCSGGSIDLSPTLFVTVAPQGDGRVSGVEWWFNDGPLA